MKVEGNVLPNSVEIESAIEEITAPKRSDRQSGKHIVKENASLSVSAQNDEIMYLLPVSPQHTRGHEPALFFFASTTTYPVAQATLCASTPTTAALGDQP